MKRQGVRQTKLEAYFGRRSRITADTDEQPDEVVIESTGMTALEMIAEAYADVDDEPEEQELVYANPVDIDHDHDYFGVVDRAGDAGKDEVVSIENVEQQHDVVYANPADVDHDHDYMGPPRIPTQTGGALGFESSDEDPVSEVDDDASKASEAEESGEEGVQEVVPVDVAPNIDDFYEVIDHAVKRIKKFGFSGYRTRFVLKDDERAGEPVEILRHVLQRFIDDAMENSREHGYSTDYMGLTFMNDGMKKANGGKGEWLVPFRAAVENNADKILQELEKFDQSENSPELFGTEITIAVTTIKRPEGGAWSRRVRKAQIRKKKKNPALVEIKNRDNLCMFRAIRVGMYYYENGGGMWKHAERHVTSDQLTHAAKMLRMYAGVAQRQNAYGLDDVKKVHEYLEQTFPGMYRILIFTPTSHTETVYNSGNNARYSICLYYNNGHFDLMKTPQKFFGAKHYCVQCEKTYEHQAGHPDCKVRCRQCFRIGYGFPCEGDWPIELECPDCRKFFPNQDCMDAHKPYSCNSFHRCVYCDVEYPVRPGFKDKGHDCKEKYCKRCFRKHTRDAGCFIQPLKEGNVKSHRIIAFDVETIIRKPAEQPSQDGEETGSETSVDDRMEMAAPFLVDDDGNDVAMEEDDGEDEAPRRRNPFVSMEAEEDSDEDEETQSQEPSEAGEANAFETDMKRTPHEVNYIAAIVTCNECIDAGRWNDFEYKDCEVCGPEKVFKCGEWELPEERDIVDEFLDFMLHDLPSGYASYAYAHNGGRYDNQLMMQKVYQREGLKPIIANSGHKMFQIRIKKTKHNNELFLRDSCLMFPMKLEDAPDAFNLPVTPKMHFPYRYNMRENYGKPIPGLPPAEDYILSKYKTDELKDFLKWHEEEDKKLREEGTLFVLEDKLEEYCYNDVEILIHALVRFRDIFNEQAGSDLFVKSCTITSGCLRLWKKKYLKEDRVAIVPNHGYGKFDRQSAVALKYLKWFAWAHGIDVRHRDSGEGEKRVVSDRGREYFLDGYIEPKAWDKPGFMRCNVDKCKYCLQKPDEQVAIEFNGCAYHGCPFKCFRSDTKLPTGKKSSEQYIITQNRAADIEDRGYTVISVHECQLKIELKQNKSMRKFFEYCFDTGHTDPRDGFCGGRVGPMRMYYKPQADEEIKFSDIVSLYPHVLRKHFPVGHPIIFRKFDDFAWDKDLWDRKYSKEFKGVFKVLVLPPKDLTIPVLPLRDNNRLLFPLCRACSVNSRKMDPFREPSCGHSDMERAFVSDTTHVELDLAFKAGYKVLRAIEVWHYLEWDNTVFEGYITDFMRLKEEATGWEGLDKIEDPEEREKAMDQFIEDYMKNTEMDGKPGVQLQKDNVRQNKALRAVMKLFFNSLWGRLAMRPNKPHCEIIRSPRKLYELLDSTTKVVESIIPLTEDAMRVQWKYVDRCDPEDENSNVVYAMFTTSYGRAELYKYMCAVEESAGGAKGAKFLYGDTDSILYVQKKGTEAIKSGRYLGEMKDEYPNHTIEEFVCGGNKQYGLLLRHNETGKITTRQKIRGITLNSETSQLLSYEKMKEMVLSPLYSDEEQRVTLPYEMIRRDYQYNVFTLATEKIYRPIFMKGWIDWKLDIWPYGYVKPEDRDLQPSSAMTLAEHYMLQKI